MRLGDAQLGGIMQDRAVRSGERRGRIWWAADAVSAPGADFARALPRLDIAPAVRLLGAEASRTGTAIGEVLGSPTDYANAPLCAQAQSEHAGSRPRAFGLTTRRHSRSDRPQCSIGGIVWL